MLYLAKCTGLSRSLLHHWPRVCMRRVAHFGEKATRRHINSDGYLDAQHLMHSGVFDRTSPKIPN